MRSYSPGFVPDIITFFMYPFCVPKNANVCGPVFAGVIDVIDSLSKLNIA